MSESLKVLEHNTRAKFDKALGHLATSVRKTEPLIGRPLDELDDDELVMLEGLAGRFGRAADLASRRLMRLLILKNDPDFDGTVRDLFDACEKRGFIDSAARWMRMREDRNRNVHEYVDDELVRLYESLGGYASDLFAFRSRI